MILPYAIENKEPHASCLIYSFDYAYSMYKIHSLPHILSMPEFECALSECNILVIERFELAYFKAESERKHCWIGYKLLINDKLYAELTEHETYKGMFYIRWKKGNKLSQDFYNISRAKDHCINYAIKDGLIRP
jgi:hypothetical protein